MNLLDALFIVALNYPLINFEANDCAAVFNKNCICSPSSEMVIREFNLDYKKIEFNRKHKLVIQITNPSLPYDLQEKLYYY